MVTMASHFEGFANKHASFQDNTSETLSAIRTRLESLPLAEVSGFDTVRSLLERIQIQITEMTVPTEPRHINSSRYGSQHASDELENALGRLSKLAQEQGLSAYSVEAQDVVNDIDALLRALLADLGANAKQHGGGKRKREMQEDGEDDSREWRPLKLVKSIVGMSDKIILNQKGACAIQV